MKPIIYALMAQMGEVKGGDFASRDQIRRVARRGMAKTRQMAAFSAAGLRKKEKPGDEYLRAQKA
jgi:hypothetical protein